MRYLPLLLAVCVVPFAQGSQVFSITGTPGATATFSLVQPSPGVYQLQISVTDDVTNPGSVADNVSALEFTLNAAGVTLNTAANANTVCVGVSDPACSQNLTTSSQVGWVFTNPTGDTYLLDDLVGTGHAGPAHTIIGPSPYTNAGGSIDGNSAHNPFLGGTVTWYIDGVSADTVVSNVLFQFGTTDGNLDPCTVCGVPGTTPEPISIALVGSGLGALFVLRRRRA